MTLSFGLVLSCHPEFVAARSLASYLHWPASLLPWFLRFHAQASFINPTFACNKFSCNVAYHGKGRATYQFKAAAFVEGIG
eukprot:6206180-Pleurochrysis_carterae.AAC.2